MTYQIGLGFDNPSLSDISPQPFSPGIIPSQRNFSSAGTVYDQGRHAVWVWKDVLTTAEFNAIMSTFGFDGSILNVECTIKTTNMFRTFVTVNAIALSPQNNQDAKYRPVAGWFNQLEIHFNIFGDV